MQLAVFETLTVDGLLDRQFSY